MTVDPLPPVPNKSDTKPAPKAQLSPKQQRIEREKAALKANMARRKAQARAKSGQGADTDGAEDAPDLDTENE